MKLAVQQFGFSSTTCHDDIRELELHLSKRQKIVKEETEPSDDFGNPFEENEEDVSNVSDDPDQMCFSSGEILNLENVPEIVIENKKNRNYQQKKLCNIIMR